MNGLSWVGKRFALSRIASEIALKAKAKYTYDQVDPSTREGQKALAQEKAMERESGLYLTDGGHTTEWLGDYDTNKDWVMVAELVYDYAKKSGMDWLLLRKIEAIQNMPFSDVSAFQLESGRLHRITTISCFSWNDMLEVARTYEEKFARESS